MKVLIIGSGGREHALCWKFAQSSKVKKVYCIEGNGGISDIAQTFSFDQNDFKVIADFAKKNAIDFTFVGPEIPLSLGIVDFFETEKLKIVGPSKKASRLESSKIFSKHFMQKYGIPTAGYNSFSNSKEASDFIDLQQATKSFVIKADGLAAGKGVLICHSVTEAKSAIAQLMDEKILGVAGAKIIIEDYVEGDELSYLIFTDGKHYSIMPASQDHKRINDNDEGPNTGGMGAYAPAPLASVELNKKVEDCIIKKVMQGLAEEKFDYKGVLYIGVIMNGDEPLVLEFNCRFGDPETQVLLPLLETDLTDICLAILDEKLDEIKISWKKENAVCVVLSSGGYPSTFQKGFEIKGLDKVNDVLVFHSGTKKIDNKIITSGGRVLGITALDKALKGAIDKVYSQVSLIEFENMHYRKDIGHRALCKK
jgi:phosphoribosylamine--glycine ligase